ncbi:MAG: hypothetical protein JWO55_351 [Candidatus Saccharibacteria bacterium]|jgi:hypothetical protein|nr:hypothetical protein [Candidatus Saccharibacteria bacterium]
MPHIKVSYPIIALELTDVPKGSAKKLRKLLGKYLKARGINARVGYSEVDSAIRIYIKSMSESTNACNALIQDTILVLEGGITNCKSISTKKGRIISWSR